MNPIRRQEKHQKSFHKLWIVGGTFSGMKPLENEAEASHTMTILAPTQPISVIFMLDGTIPRESPLQKKRH